MNKTKRIISLVLSIVMIFSAVPLSALAYTTDGTTDDTAAPSFTENLKNGDITNIYANGTPIVLDVDESDSTDTNVYLWDENGNKLSDLPVRENTAVYGSAKNAQYQNVRITVKSGKFSMVVGATTNAVVGNVEINIEGGEIARVGAGITADVTAAEINISGGEVTTCVSPGSNPVNIDSVTVNVSGGTDR